MLEARLSREPATAAAAAPVPVASPAVALVRLERPAERGLASGAKAGSGDCVMSSSDSLRANGEEDPAYESCRALGFNYYDPNQRCQSGVYTRRLTMALLPQLARGPGPIAASLLSEAA